MHGAAGPDTPTQGRAAVGRHRRVRVEPAHNAVAQAQAA